MNDLKIVLIGNANVGKTCVVKKATIGTFSDDTVPTLGASYASKIVKINDQDVRLQIWDTAGQEKYRGMTPMYYRGSQIALIVYSIIDMESFKAIDGWIESLRENAEPDIIMFLIGNKYDLDSQRAVETSQGQEKANEIGASFYEVSAKTGYQIDEMFNEIPASYMEKCANKKKTTDPSLDLKGDNAEEKKKSCC